MEEDNRVWLARKPKPLLDNAAVRFDSDTSMRIEWTHCGLQTSGSIDRKLARLLARRINEALDSESRI